MVAYSSSCGCATLFNSTNFKEAPRSSFVKIEVATNEYVSTGSGVIINHLDNLNTIILTAGHICKPNTIAMRVLDLYEKEYNILGFVVAKDDDLCLIMVDGLINGIRIKMSDTKPEIGDHVYNIAAPMGIHAPDMELMFDGYFQGQIKLKEEVHASDIHSIAGMGGSSGSPIFDKNWNLVGIVSRGMTEFNEIMLSVNYERVKLFYEYSFSTQFKIDMINAKKNYSKTIDELIKDLMGLAK